MVKLEAAITALGGTVPTFQLFGALFKASVEQQVRTAAESRGQRLVLHIEVWVVRRSVQANFKCCFEGNCSQRWCRGAPGCGGAWEVLVAASEVQSEHTPRRKAFRCLSVGAQGKGGQGQWAFGGRHTGVVRFCAEGQVRQVCSGVVEALSC